MSFRPFLELWPLPQQVPPGTRVLRRAPAAALGGPSVPLLAVRMRNPCLELEGTGKNRKGVLQ